MRQEQIRAQGFGLFVALRCWLLCRAVWPLLRRAADQRPAVAHRAPDFALPAAVGSNVRLSEYRGQPVVLSFWSSRCGACAAQLAALDRYYATYRSAGLVVLGVSVEDDPQRALDYARAHRRSFPLLLDRAKAVSRAYEIDRLPTTVLIDRSGVVRYLHSDDRPDDASYVCADSRPAGRYGRRHHEFLLDRMQSPMNTMHSPPAAPLWPLLLASLSAPSGAGAAAAPPGIPRLQPRLRRPPRPGPRRAAARAPAAARPMPAAATPAPARAALDEQIQDLKKDVVDLNKDLFVLEEELLFPANTQVAVFVSMDVGRFLRARLDQLKIDNKEVINYLYTPREVAALLKGGVQRLYVGNLKAGAARAGGALQRQGSERPRLPARRQPQFEKGVGAKYLELKINDQQRTQQPEFEIKDWE